MRYTVVCRKPDHFLLANRLRQEEHDVQVLALPGEVRYDGLLPVVSAPSQVIKYEPDIVLFADPGLGVMAKNLQDVAGLRVVNGGVYQDELAHNPDWGALLANRVGFAAIPGFSFDRLTIKLAGFFSKKGFLPPALIYQEEKQLIPGAGPETVEGVTMAAIPPDTAGVVDETFIKVEKALAALKYIGFVFVDIQIAEDGKPLCVRMTSEAPEGFYASFLSGLETPFGDVIKGSVFGRRFTHFKFSEGFACALRATLPPYPHIDFPWLAKEEKEEVLEKVTFGSKGLSLPEEILHRKDIMPVDVRRSKGGQLVTTGPVVTYIGAAEDPQRLALLISAASRSLSLPSIQVRPVVGYGLGYDFAVLEDAGLLNKKQEEPNNVWRDDVSWRHAQEEDGWVEDHQVQQAYQGQEDHALGHDEGHEEEGEVAYDRVF